MIQRIQTIYLAISAALSGWLLNGDIVKLLSESGENYTLSYKGISVLNENGVELLEKSLPLTILLFLVPVLYFIAIFLFKNRKLQIRVSVLSTLLFAGAFLLMGFYIFYTGKKLEASIVFNIKIVFPLVGMIFGYLAFRSILKDELLIKSYDRLR